MLITMINPGQNIKNSYLKTVENNKSRQKSEGIGPLKEENHICLTCPLRVLLVSVAQGNWSSCRRSYWAEESKVRI